MLDADASIKLTKIGIIKIAAETFNIVITKEVYEEQVIVGLKRGFPDAKEVEELVLSKKIEVKEVTKQLDALSKNRRIGRGEKSAANYYLFENADLICSDDEAFLNTLEELDIGYMPSAGIILMLINHGVLKKEEGMKYLNRMKTMIKAEHYYYAKKTMEVL